MTVAKPALFSLPGNTGRAVALGVIGTLGKSAPGRALIEFLGHMAPDPRLAVTLDGTVFPSPVGLGWRVDPEREATRALSLFGVGCLEFLAGENIAVSRSGDESLTLGNRREIPDRAAPEIGCPVLIRRRAGDGSEPLTLPSGKSLAVVPWDTPVPAEISGAGIVLQTGTGVSANGSTGSAVVFARLPEDLPAAVRAWRARLPGGILIVAGGVGGPDDAVALREAGADLILVDAGLVFRGPGLISRCNDALSVEGRKSPAVPEPGELFRYDWFWAALLGATMTLGGFATLLLAYTRVLLPYDEHYLGTTLEAIRLTQPRLFDFMAHDRATLGGTMTGLGFVYLMVAFRSIRKGVHGARTVLIASSIIGFSTFFAFFGFGYFDALHAFVSLFLIQMTVQVMVGRTAPEAAKIFPVERDDALWLRAQWGQLLWLVHAAGLMIAGAAILLVGMTSVFVAEDLDFLCVTPERMNALGEKFVAVIAHDRATTGGMLLCSGVAMMLLTLRCARRGEAWVWTGILGLGIPAYLGTLGVHFFVGYTDWRHLLPAFAGLALWLGGLALTRGYLTARNDRKV